MIFESFLTTFEVNIFEVAGTVAKNCLDRKQTTIPKFNHVKLVQIRDTHLSVDLQ